MKKLHTMIDSRLGVSYDLMLTTFGELQNLIVSSSGMSIDDIRLRYDSAMYNDNLVAVKDEDLWFKEGISSLRESLNGEKLLKRMKLIARRGLDNMTYWHKMSSYSSYESIEDEEVIAFYTDLNKKILNLNTFDELVLLEKETDYLPFKVNTTVYHPSISRGISYNEPYSDYTDINAYFHIIKENKKEVAFSYSDSYKKYRDLSINMEQQSELKDIFNNERVEQTINGLENYNFVVEKTDDSYILLDGFNRLFGSNYSDLEKEVIVKLYSNIDKEKYGRLVLNLNDWKIKRATALLSTDKDYFLIFDRGVLFSLEMKFGILPTDITSNFYSIITPLKSKIILDKGRKYFVDVAEKSILFIKLAEENNLSQTLIEFIFDKDINKLNKNNVKDFVKELITLDTFDKINSYTSNNGLRNYLYKSDYYELISKYEKGN